MNMNYNYKIDDFRAKQKIKQENLIGELIRKYPDRVKEIIAIKKLLDKKLYSIDSNINTVLDYIRYVENISFEFPEFRDIKPDLSLINKIWR